MEDVFTVSIFLQASSIYAHHNEMLWFIKGVNINPMSQLHCQKLLPATACNRNIIYTQRASRATTAVALQKSCQHIRNTWPPPRRVP